MVTVFSGGDVRISQPSNLYFVLNIIEILQLFIFCYFTSYIIIFFLYFVHSSIHILHIKNQRVRITMHVCGFVYCFALGHSVTSFLAFGHRTNSNKSVLAINISTRSHWNAILCITPTSARLVPPRHHNHSELCRLLFLFAWILLLLIFNSGWLAGWLSGISKYLQNLIHTYVMRLRREAKQRKRNEKPDAQ